MPQPLHILIAANPKSGAVSRPELLDGLRDSLIGDGFTVDVCTCLDQVERQAVELHDAGRLRAVVSAGGDGTAAALANRITSQIPLLIFPMGTENLLAKHLADVGRSNPETVSCLLPSRTSGVSKRSVPSIKSP